MPPERADDQSPPGRRPLRRAAARACRLRPERSPLRAARRSAAPGDPRGAGRAVPGDDHARDRRDRPRARDLPRARDDPGAAGHAGDGAAAARVAPGKARPARPDEPARRPALRGRRPPGHVDPRSGGGLRLPRAAARRRARDYGELRPHLAAADQRGADHDDPRDAQPAVGGDEPLSGGALRAPDPGDADGNLPAGLDRVHRARRAAAAGQPGDLGHRRLRDAGRFADLRRGLRRRVGSRPRGAHRRRRRRGAAARGEARAPRPVPQAGRGIVCGIRPRPFRPLHLPACADRPARRDRPRAPALERERLRARGLPQTGTSSPGAAT
jgi:hypothetical protein